MLPSYLAAQTTINHDADKLIYTQSQFCPYITVSLCFFQRVPNVSAGKVNWATTDIESSSEVFGRGG